MGLKKIGIITVLAFSGFFTLCFATTFVPQPFQKSVLQAPIIARGKIGMSYANWGNSTDSQRIFTFYAFEIADVLKGNLGSTSNVIIREMGGEKDGLGLHIEGTAHFERGEEVVVFLNERNPDGSFDIHGMMMGKLNLEKNSDGEEILKGPALWIARSATSFDSTPQKQWTLESLKNLIQEQATPPSPRPEGPPTPQFTQPASRHTSSLPTPDLPTPQAASPLQHTPEERGFTWLSGWVGILGLGLLGTLARLWRKRRRGASH